jgi:hypothetical protein
MPTLSRYFIRSALLCLALSFTLGGLILAAKGGAVDPQVWEWLPVHMAVLLNGWLVQLSLGVAYWILPRVYLRERGRRAWAWAGFAFFQAGLALTLLAAAGLWLPAAANFFAPSLILQVAGVALFAVHAWPRIRPTFVRTASKQG